MSDNPLMKWGERDFICALAHGGTCCMNSRSVEIPTPSKWSDQNLRIGSAFEPRHADCLS